MKSEDTVEFVITESEEGLRLDQALTKAGFVENRSQALKLIKLQQVIFQNRPLRASHKVKSGENLRIVLIQKKPLSISKKPLECLYEDEAVLVVNKPAGLVVHPAPGHDLDTLVNRLISDKKLSSGTDSFRPGVVHRLDKDVSGLLVFAKNKQAEVHLIQQFKERLVKRVYWAITLKAPLPAENKVETYLSRHLKKRKIFVSSRTPLSGSKKAITFYKVLTTNSGSGLTWLECQLKTGRTHQIRIHLASLGCPLIGDRTYGSFKGVYSFKNRDLSNLCRSLNRIALHAHSLGFVHPVTKKELYFSIPWPKDIKELAAALGFDKIALKEC